jgi:PAS domain S-box-containing protein
MKQEHTCSGRLADLRREAEGRAAAGPADSGSPLDPVEAQRLVHELQVHQIELELLLEANRSLEQRIALRTKELQSANAQLRREVTERGKAQADLSLANREWLATFNANSDPIMLLGTDHRIRRANKAMADLIGLPVEELAGKFCHDLVHDSLAPIAVCPQSKLLQDGLAHSEEVFLEKLDRTYLVTVSPVFDTAHQVVSSIHHIKDISELKRLKDTLETRVLERTEELRKSEELYQLATSVAKEAIWEVDFSTGLTRWNGAYNEMFGRPGDQHHHGKWWLKQIHPDDRARVNASFEDALAKGPDLWVCDYRMKIPGDGYLFISDRATIVRDAAGAPLRVVGAKQDVTEQVRAAEEALASKTKLEAALASMNDAVSISDAHGCFIEFNDAFASFHKYRSKEECARTFAQYCELFDVYLADGEPAAPEQWAVSRALRGETASNAEYTLRRRDSGETWVGSYSFAPIRGRDGAVVGSVVTARDITSRKLVEKALIDSEQRVRNKLESILSPEGDLGNLALRDIIDLVALQRLVDSFYRINGIPVGIMGLDDDSLVLTGWQDVCTKFHRAAPETCQLCRESNREISQGIAAGEFRVYKCKNNLWDAVTPFMVAGRHYGDIFCGQFFFEDEEVDYGVFREQARRYGFEEKEYLAALEQVPRINREKLEATMGFYAVLADLISKLSYSNIKLARSLTERDSLTQSLRASEDRFRVLADSMPGLVWTARPEGLIDYWNQFALDYAGIREIGSAILWQLEFVHPDDREATRQVWHNAINAGTNYQREHRLRRRDGMYRWHLSRGIPLRDEQGGIVKWYGTTIDIHDLREAQHKLNTMAMQLALAEEGERCRIAGELHDQVGPTLLLSRMKIHALASLLPTDEGEGAIETIDALLLQAVKDVRTLTFQLRPPVLANAGLEAALKWLAEEFRENYGLQVTIDDDKELKPLRYEVRSTVFQVVRELLYNITKHAGTSNAGISLKKAAGRMVITVQDAGSGFDVATTLYAGHEPRGYGLYNIREKIEYFGGQMVFDASPGQGTRVTIAVPVEPLDSGGGG